MPPGVSNVTWPVIDLCPHSSQPHSQIHVELIGSPCRSGQSFADFKNSKSLVGFNIGKFMRYKVYPYHIFRMTSPAIFQWKKFLRQFLVQNLYPRHFWMKIDFPSISSINTVSPPISNENRFPRQFPVQKQYPANFKCKSISPPFSSTKTVFPPISTKNQFIHQFWMKIDATAILQPKTYFPAFVEKT